MTATAPEMEMPVSAYDPKMQELVPDIEGRIRAELSEIGDVVRIEGSILPSLTQGVLMDGVVAVVKHPAATDAMLLDVRWDKDSSALKYKDVVGREFVPHGSGYAATGQLEADVARKAFAAMEQHPIWSMQRPWRKGADISELVIFSMLGVFLLVSGGVASLFAPTDMTPPTANEFFIAMMCGTTAALLMLGGLMLVRRKEIASYNQHREVAASWNADRESALKNALPDPSDRAVFTEALLREASANDLSGVKNVAVSKVPYADPESRYLKKPMVVFKALDTNGYLCNHVFDGKHIYRLASSGELQPGKSFKIVRD